jgi:tRNA (cmo5U34)-methyltransferase
LTDNLQKSRDRVFAEKIEKQFQFDDGVASVFDDMVERSVPFYHQNRDLIVQILKKTLKEGETVLDLGCSTASFLLQIEREIENLKLFGIDNSEPMLKEAQRKIGALNSKIELSHGDFQDLDFPKNRVSIMNYTLQFVRPLQRENLLRKIYDSLEVGGMLFLSEKVLFKNGKFQKDITDIYYQFKEKNGYSKYEIAQKREALENILIPYTLQENRELLQNSGFDEVETIFQWGNFATFLAVKN